MADERFSNAWQQLPAGCQLFSVFVFPPKVGGWGVGGWGGWGGGSTVNPEHRMRERVSAIDNNLRAVELSYQITQKVFVGCLPAKALPKGPPLTFNCTFPLSIEMPRIMNRETAHPPAKRYSQPTRIAFTAVF